MNASIKQASTIDVFWGELSACDHCVRIYENDAVFIDTLFGFVSGGLRLDEAVVLIATPAHLDALESRLVEAGIDLPAMRRKDQYIALDAEQTLAKFMVDGWPDDAGFSTVVSDVLLRAKARGRKVRAFGEMVALMWAQGHCAAVIRLEHLWTELCEKESFSLFCAYPRTGFTTNANISIAQVCETHSKVVAI